MSSPSGVTGHCAIMAALCSSFNPVSEAFDITPREQQPAQITHCWNIPLLCSGANKTFSLLLTLPGNDKNAFARLIVKPQQILPLRKNGFSRFNQPAKITCPKV